MILVGGEALGELAALEPVAEAIFGRGRRTAGWFARKLVREGVDPELCGLLCTGDDPRSAAVEDVRGYALLGRAASLVGVARGAGVGVVPELRGAGWGSALVEFVAERARGAGLDAIEFLSEPDRLAWYRARGFRAIAEQVTLSSPTAATPPDESGGRSTAFEPGEASVVWSWIPENWARTPEPERWQDRWPHATTWCSREGRATLVHRLELIGVAASTEVIVATVRAVHRAAPADRPVLLYPCPAGAEWVEALRSEGWSGSQRSFVVRRSTASSARDR